MTDKTTTALSQREREALADIKGWGRTPYIWKQASMARLEARGLVRKTGQSYGSAYAYELTDEGKNHG